MARNSEKALSMMNKWVAMKTQEQYLRSVKETTRPENINSVKTISDAQKWRQYVIADIAKKIVKVQRLSLTEPDATSLNNDINDLIQEQRQWEQRIKTLGGPDYSQVSRTTLQSATYCQQDGKYYFGVAKKYMPQPQPTLQVTSDYDKRSKNELVKIADPFYYGFLDETDELLNAERIAEEKILNHS
ncbi:hypothetical protein RCL1_003279 [Eukaryota sp. TZLM3-RCL]